MRRTFTFVVFIAAMVVAVPDLGYAQNPATQAPTEQRLLEQIRFGEMLYRDDIIEDAVERLYRVSPQNTEGLLAQVRLNTRLERLEVAEQFLKKLQTIDPNSHQAREAALLVELTSSEAEQKLTRARLLVAAGRVDDALEIYDSLLNGLYPSAELAQEYWSARVQQKAGIEQAKNTLTKLLDRFGMHPALLKLLVTLHFRLNQPDRALYYLKELAKHSSERLWAARRQYEYLTKLDVSHHSKALLLQFVEQYADIPDLIDPARERLKTQSALLDDPAWWAGQEGISSIKEQRNPQEALLKLQIALEKYPDDVGIIGNLGLAYLRLGNRPVALEYFNRAIETEQHDDRKSKWMRLAESTEHWLLLERASQAQREGRTSQAIAIYQEVLNNDPENLFALIGMGDVHLRLKQKQQAWKYFLRAAELETANEMTQRAVVRYANSFEPEYRVGVLQSAPAEMQDSTVLRKAKSSAHVALLRRKAEKAQQAGDTEQMLALWRQIQAITPSDVWLSYALATTLRDSGREQEAFETFDLHYRDHVGQPSTEYAMALLLASVSRWDEARDTLNKVPESQWTEFMHELAHRIDQTLVLEQALALEKAGNRQAAVVLLRERADTTQAKLYLAEWAYDDNDFEQALAYYKEVQQVEPLSASSYRGMSRAWLGANGEPQQALDWYAQGMVQAEMLHADALNPMRDDAAFTYAMRHEDDDDWLRSGLRSDASLLYQQQNPTLTVHEDYWWRNDGTPGLSDLKASTTMAQLDYPVSGGVGFLRMDHVRMDAGTLQATGGVYRGEFGSCGFSGSGGCTSDLSQKAIGTSLAFGWKGNNLSWDIGTTPLGFKVVNWTGGISYADKWNQIGWRVTASHRPMSNSILSFAGTQDPITGQIWGGVMATGAALSLSWDQGKQDGVWADFSYHSLRGKNVEQNHRFRIMGGYYHRLINKRNEVLTVGVNMMHWQYQKDSGGYSFGQGGYYSPKSYQSVSLPLRYAKRNGDLSFFIQGGVSFTSAKSHVGSRSQGVGYFLKGAIERRLTNHLVIGAGIDFQRSKDYTPNRAMLYLRYTFQPWRGSLPLGPDPLTPYADFK